MDAEDRPLPLADILNAVDTALLLLTARGVVVLANGPTEELLEHPASGLLGRCLHEAVEFLGAAGRPVPARRLPWIRAASEAVVAVEVVTLRTRGGRDVEVRVRAEPTGEQPRRVIVTLHEEVAAVVQSLRDELAHSRLLQEVAVVATSSSDLRIVCTRVLKALARHIGLVGGDVRVLSADGATLRLVASHGYPDEMVRLIEEVPADGGDSIAQRSLASGAAFTDADDRARPERAGILEEEKHRDLRYVSMAIDFRKRRVGALTFAFRETRSFTEDEMGLFHAVARILGQTIESSRLLDAEKESRCRATAELEISSLLLEAAERLSHALELEEVCDALAEVLEGLTGRSRVVVALHQPRRNRMVVTAARNTRKTRRGESEELEGRAAALADGRHKIVKPMEDLPPEQLALAEAEDALLALLVPLRAHDRFLGFATMDEPGEDRPFTDREIRLAESVASQAAVLIENARVYEAEHRIAETLQESLLLMPDRVPGVRFGTLYRSATAAARVGGDFYDVFETGGHTVALLVGDVSGKGLDAASVTALARNAVRIYGSEGLRPSEVMSRTSDVLRRFTSPETFVTAFFGVLDMRTGALTYVSAGHPEGMIVGAGGYVATLPGESPVLGAFEDVEFAERVTMVAPTDTILIYTDGVTEARGGRELYGSERLSALLEGVGDADPLTLPAKVFAAIEAFAEGRLRDDVAMLAVRREIPEEP